MFNNSLYCGYIIVIICKLIIVITITDLSDSAPDTIAPKTIPQSEMEVVRGTCHSLVHTKSHCNTKVSIDIQHDCIAKENEYLWDKVVT